MASSSCSICDKNEATCNCNGCKKFFCIKDFIDHRRHLSIQFDQDIVRTHDELFELLDLVKQSKNSFADLFIQIDRWEAATVDILHSTAEKARHQLTHLIDSERDTLTKQFGALSKEIRRRREDDDFAEDNLKHLQIQINQLRQSVEQLTQSNNTKLISIEISQIDWNRLIYAQRIKEPSESIKNKPFKTEIFSHANFQ
jgi:hypothetical protein